MDRDHAATATAVDISDNTDPRVPSRRGEGLGELDILMDGVVARLRAVEDPLPVDADAILNEIDDVRRFGHEGSISERLLDRVALLDPGSAREKLESILRQVAAPLHFRPILPSLIAELERRRLSGYEWRDLTDAIKLKIPLLGYAVTMVDANAYTAPLLEGDSSEQLKTFADLIRALSECAETTGAVLMEPIVGDLGRFLTFSPEQQASLEDALNRLRVPMKIEKLKGRTYPNGERNYPIDPDTGIPSFTFSTGVRPAEEGLVILAYAGRGNRRGGVMVHGPSIEEAETLQKQAGPGETLREGSFGEAVPKPEWNAESALPQSNLILMKLIEALLQMSSYSDAAVADLLNGVAVDRLTPRLEAYYVVLSLEGGDVETFWDQFVQEGTGTDNIVLFKPVGARELHFWSKDIQNPEQFQTAFEGFVRQLKAMAKKAGCGMKLGLGHEQALDLLHLPGSFQVDATGAVIVGTVRAVSALHGQSGDMVNVDETACAALGLRGVERITRYIKGRAYQGVHLSIEDDGGLSIPEPLVGRERELAALHDFVDRLGQNGVVLQVRKSDGAQEGGYGESALLRATERYAHEEKQFTNDQVANLGSGENLFDDLEAKLGHKVGELMEHPDLLTRPVLLLWDADTVSPEDAARVDRFLFAVAGAPIGLVSCGAYQFRPGAMTGDHYRGRALSANLELHPLGPDEAIDLVFQTRMDLDRKYEPRIRQLLQGWKGPLTPRLLIRNFAPALEQLGANVNLNAEVLGQVWAGELAHILDAANLDENARTVLGVLMEIGFPVSFEDLQGFLPRFSIFASLQQLVVSGLLESVEKDGVERFVAADPKYRKARLLARQYAPEIRKNLMNHGFFHSDAETEVIDEERSAVELEHTLGHAETCGDQRTFHLVFRLGHHYLKDKKDFGAAYELSHRFLEACKVHNVGLETLPQELVHDLVWVLTQTKDKKDAVLARSLLVAQENPSPELFWRARAQLPKFLPDEELPTLPQDHPHRQLLGRLASLSGELGVRGTGLQRELENALRLEALFIKEGASAQEKYGSAPLLPLAFSADALSRTAYASRLFARLALEIAEKLPTQTELVSDLDSAKAGSIDATRNQLASLQATLVFLETSTDLDQELKAEILKYLLITHKYLSPVPNDGEVKQLYTYHGKVTHSFAELERPSHAASLEASDVYRNAVALHWQWKLPLPGVFDNENEATAGGESRETIWAVLEDHEAEVRTQLGESVRHALLPIRYRLILQLMNFVQLKMRLVARTFTPQDRPLFDRLHGEYVNLVRDSAHLHQFLEGRPQPAYYDQECLPIKVAVDQMTSGF